jgi:hypothetical protein
MTDARVQQAVRNNAVWCDTVCRAHGSPGEFFEEIWVNRHSTPRFYPNAVTLSPTGSATQCAHISTLIAAAIAGEWAVKDSFSTLDVEPLGLRTLFEAQWIYRPASLRRPTDPIADVRWVRIDDAAALRDWETAWGGEAGAGQARLFLSALLADENVAVMAAYRHERIVAGAMVNRAAGVAGLSNVFVPAHDGARFWAGCVAAAVDAFPGLALVGYEAGRELAVAGAQGFETLGPLRVWVRDSAAAV